MSISSTVVDMTMASFRETLATLSFFDSLEISTQENLQLSNKEYFSVMTTVSASDFRMAVLLHVPLLQSNGNSLSQHMNINDKEDAQKQYLDHVYEYSNNLCGMFARHVQASGYTTGISQPAILNLAYTDAEIDAISPTCKAHTVSKINGELSLCASMCIFLNSEDMNSVSLKVEDADEFNEISGELEFF